MDNNQTDTVKKLYRSRSDRYLGGVAGGIATYLNLDSALVRIILALSVFVGGSGLVVYIAALLLVPENEDEEFVANNNTNNMNSNLFWGILFVALGCIILFRQFNLMDWFFFSDIPWKTIWAICLIGIGGFLLYSQTQAEKTTELGDEEEGTTSPPPFQLNIERSRTDRKIAGICGGLANHFKLDTSLVRLAWLAGTVLSGGLGLVIYILLIFIFPEESTEQAASDSI